MMTALDAAELMPDAHEETNNSHWAGKRWYTPIPTLHVRFILGSSEYCTSG